MAPQGMWQSCPSVGIAGQQSVKDSGWWGERAQRPVSQEVLALAGDTDPITGLGGDGGSIHPRRSHCPPSQSCHAGLAPGARLADQWGSSVHARHSSIASQAWWWCRMGASLGSAGWGGLGAALGGLRGARAACVAWGVSLGSPDPQEVDKGTAKGRVRGGQANPKRGPGGQGADGFLPGSRGDGMWRWSVLFSAQTSRQALPASLARGEINC